MKRPGGRRPRLRIVAEFLVIAGVIAFAWFQRAAIDRSVEVVGRAEWNWLLLAGALELLSLMAFARTERVVLRAAGVHVPIPKMAATALAENAISVSLPLIGPGAGMIFTYGRFQQVAGDAAPAGWSMLISGLTSNLAWALLLAAGAIVSGNPSATLSGLLGGGAILVAAILGVIALHRQRARQAVTRAAIRLIRLAQKLTGRPASDADDLTNNALNRLSTFRMSWREWAQAAWLSVINWLASVGCLAAAILAVGASVPWTKLLLVYCAGAAASSFNLTPGGLGVVEAVLAGGLVAAGMPSGVALGSVLIFRLLSFWLAMVVGWAIYALIRRANRSADGAPERYTSVDQIRP